MVRVMIADDHALIRRVVREIVEKESDMEMVAEARDGYEAETQAAQAQPDVILMDLDMPECDGFVATERIQNCSPQSRVIILTASRHEHHAFAAIQRGAIGYLSKDIEPEALVHAIRCAARDEVCLPRPLVARILTYVRSAQLPAAPAEPLYRPISLVGGKVRSRSRQPEGLSEAESQQTVASHPLTQREMEILDLMRKGHKNREIAGALNVAESTVHKHVQNILEKLHARNRTEAIYLTNPTQTAS